MAALSPTVEEFRQPPGVRWSKAALSVSFCPQQQRHGASVQHEVQERGAPLRPAAGDAGRPPNAQRDQPRGHPDGGDAPEPHGRPGPHLVTFLANVLHQWGGGEFPRHNLRAPPARPSFRESLQHFTHVTYTTTAKFCSCAHAGMHPPPWLPDTSGHAFACSVLSGIPSSGGS